MMATLAGASKLVRRPIRLIETRPRALSASGCLEGERVMHFTFSQSCLPVAGTSSVLMTVGFSPSDFFFSTTRGARALQRKHIIPRYCYEKRFLNTFMILSIHKFCYFNLVVSPINCKHQYHTDFYMWYLGTRVLLQFLNELPCNWFKRSKEKVRKPKFKRTYPTTSLHHVL
jgi:hypothetical protein